jgi:hypothetical protein
MATWVGLPPSGPLDLARPQIIDDPNQFKDSFNFMDFLLIHTVYEHIKEEKRTFSPLKFF